MMTSNPTEALAGGILTVDCAAVVANWRRLGQQMQGRPCAAVLKADAYGLGAAPIAAALARAGCEDFFVAMPEEGIRLRQTLPNQRIHVLSGPFDSVEPFVTHRLIPALNSPQQVALWMAEAPDKPYSVHVDTGMNRIGLSMTEFAALSDLLSPILLISHMACPDEPDHPLNRQQLQAFQAACAKMPTVPASFASSSALFLGPEYCFDLGRPGLALYGGNPTPGRANPMQAVLALALRIVQVRRIDSPGTVGYGASRTVAPGMRLACVAAGYADGLMRSLSNRGTGRLGEWSVPMVGRVSMDLISFDVSAVPEEMAQAGQWISVLGGDLDADRLGAAAQTLSYEVLTSLSTRYARRYLGSA